MNRALSIVFAFLSISVLGILFLLSSFLNDPELFSATVSGPPVEQDNYNFYPPIPYMALGDSYTIGESVGEKQRWPFVLSKKLTKAGYETKVPDYIARTGWRSDQLNDACEEQHDDDDWDLVSLQIGVNNEYQGRSAKSFEKDFRKSLHWATEYCQNNKEGVFVLSIPDYGYTPHGKSRQEKISSRIDEYNEVCERVCKEEGILYIDITDISRKGFEDPSLVAKDGLHPSAKQYELWVDRAIEPVLELIKKGDQD